MRRYSCHRLLGVVILAAIFAATLSAAAPSAHADTLLQQKEKRLAHVRAQVKMLDARAERVTAAYNKAVYRLGILHQHILKNKAQLIATQAKLVRDEHILAKLLVDQYKRGNTQDFAILIGARSLSQVTNAIDLKARSDQAVSDTVHAIHAARDLIADERRALFAEQNAVRAQRRILVIRRIEVQKMLRRRQALVSELGIEVSVIKGAASIGQAQLALSARQWIKADQKQHKDDPGQVLRDKVVLEGMQEIGVPYVWGGASPSGFDCSGLVMWLWAKHGLALPHFAASQYAPRPGGRGRPDARSLEAPDRRSALLPRPRPRRYLCGQRPAFARAAHGRCGAARVAFPAVVHRHLRRRHPAGPFLI